MNRWVVFSFKDDNITSYELCAVFTCEAVEGGGDEVLVMRRMEEVIAVG